MIFNIILIIISIIILIFVYKKYIFDVNILESLDDEYFNNINLIPEPIFDFSLGNLNQLIEEYNNLKILDNELSNRLNELELLRENLIILIEENNETIMNLQSAINELKEQIYDVNNFTKHIFINTD